MPSPPPEPFSSGISPATSTTPASGDLSSLLPPLTAAHAAVNRTGSSASVSVSIPRISRATFEAVGVGAGIGGLIVLIAACIAFFFYRKRKRRRRRRKMAENFFPSKAPYADDYSPRPGVHFQNNSPPPDSMSSEQCKTSPPGFSEKVPAPHVLVSTSGSLGSDKPLLPQSGDSDPLGLSRSFAYEDLTLATNNFSSANLLGQGGFGFVHKGVLPNGKDAAVKQLKTGGGQGEREFRAEVGTISRVQHRHLVSLLGFCISGSERLLVYEYVPNKTLEFHLHGNEETSLSWPTRLKIALGAAKGLTYLHEGCHPKIIHRDIKASNILLDDHFEAKVADFGLAKLSLDTDTHVSTRVMGTFGYMAPEYASSGKLTDKSDVFSFGVVLLELITGRRPIDKAHSFIDDSMVEWARPLLAEALEGGSFDVLVDPRLHDYNSSEMAVMVACASVCVHHSARLRPQMSQIVRALEGNLSVDDLFKEYAPGHSRAYGS